MTSLRWDAVVNGRGKTPRTDVENSEELNVDNLG